MKKTQSMSYVCTHMSVYTDRGVLAGKEPAWCKIVLHLAPQVEGEDASFALSKPYPMWLRDRIAIRKTVENARLHGVTINSESDSSIGFMIEDIQHIPVEYRKGFSQYGMLPKSEIVYFETRRVWCDQNGRPIRKNGRVIEASKTTLTWWDGAEQLFPELSRKERENEMNKEWIPTGLLISIPEEGEDEVEEHDKVDIDDPESDK